MHARRQVCIIEAEIVQLAWRHEVIGDAETADLCAIFCTCDPYCCEYGTYSIEDADEIDEEGHLLSGRLSFGSCGVDND